MNWRTQKRQMRQQVDTQFRIPCWRIFHDGTAVATWARLTIARPNITNSYAGELESLGYAERANQSPRLMLWRERVGELKEGEVFIFAADEGYQVEAVRPSYVETQDVDCFTMTPRQVQQAIASAAAAGHIITFPVPEID